MAHIVERNIKALVEKRSHEERNKSFQDKIADTVTRFTGSMLFVYIHLVLFGIWICWNMGLLGLKPFDPSFVILAMEASVEAIFLSTFVLISQNRSNALADKRAELDLQVSLLAEHEITRVLGVVVSVAKKLGISNEEMPELHDLLKDVKPEKVLDKIDTLKNEK
ncbi:MAG: rane protein [Sphingobacteriaceae bacterium]|nr:rane protein [Sphingobacteriaceae bacterium]